MSRQNYIFTSESVSEGHPDKVCDRISDAILDALIAEEPNARVAAETFATSGMVVIGGEVGLSDQEILRNHMGRIQQIARDCIRDIGYEQEKFHWNTCHVLNFLHEQSAHIAQGVDRDGAGDQGIMFGYATDETDALMPAPIQFSHAILRRLAEARKSGAEPTLRPDAKSQISLRYEDGKPVEVTQIVLSTQHASEDQTSDDIRAIVEPYIREVLPADWINDKTEWWVNPTGTFVIGGPDGDAGLTGQFRVEQKVSHVIFIEVHINFKGSVEQHGVHTNIHCVRLCPTCSWITNSCLCESLKDGGPSRYWVECRKLVSSKK